MSNMSNMSNMTKEQEEAKKQFDKLVRKAARLKAVGKTKAEALDAMRNDGEFAVHAAEVVYAED